MPFAFLCACRLAFAPSGSRLSHQQAVGHMRRGAVAAAGNMNPGNVQPGKGHQVGRNRLIAGRDRHQPVPGDNPAVDFDQIAENLPGSQDIIHTVMGHGPSVADVSAVKTGRFAAALVNSNGDFLGQLVQMNASGVRISEDISHRALRGLRGPGWQPPAAKEKCSPRPL